MLGEGKGVSVTLNVMNAVSGGPLVGVFHSLLIDRDFSPGRNHLESFQRAAWKGEKAPLIGSRAEENALLTSGVKGQNGQIGGRPWKSNRQSNNHRLEPIITKEMTPDRLHFMYAEQTVASINSFITLLVQFVGSAMSALTDLPARLIFGTFSCSLSVLLCSEFWN